MITRRTIGRVGAAALAALSIALIAALLTLGGAQADGHTEGHAEDGAAAPEAAATTISVQGSASQSLTTDETVIEFNVSALSEQATGAVQQAELALAAVTTRLRWMGGVDHEQLFTRNVSLREEYDWTDAGRVLRGYRYTHSLSLKVEGTDGAGAVIDAIVRAGEGKVSIDNVSFTASNRAATERSVLLAAVRDARATAEAIAAEIGKAVVDTLEVRVTSGLSPVGVTEEQAEAATADSDFSAPQLRGGQEDVRVSVQVVFAAR